MSPNLGHHDSHCSLYMYQEAHKAVTFYFHFPLHLAPGRTVFQSFHLSSSTVLLQVLIGLAWVAEVVLDSATLQTIIASILRENMLGYLSADIICSEKRRVFREPSSSSTVHFSEQVMSKDKYSIQAYFRAKWRLFCLLSFKCFWQQAQLWKLGNI